jgi:DNA-binding transcriptional LysR family regulator
VEIAQVEAFLAVATFGSFRRAAAALNITQPAVSARIKALEASLGVQLFERKQGLTLTLAGRRLRPYAEQLLRAATLGKLAVHKQDKGGEMVLSLSAVLPLCRFVLPHALKSFRSMHPQVMITLRSGHPKEILQMLLCGDADIGLASSLHHPNLEAISLGEDPFILVGPSNSPMTPQGPARLVDIADQPLIFFDRGSPEWILSHDLFNRAGISPNIALEVESIDLAIRMVEYGMGLALVPRLSVVDELRRRKLVKIHVSDTDLPRGSLDVLRSRTVSPTSASLAFIDALRATYARITSFPDIRDRILDRHSRLAT